MLNVLKTAIVSITIITLALTVNYLSRKNEFLEKENEKLAELNKYEELNNVLVEAAKIETGYNRCIETTRYAVDKLKENGIKSSIMIGETTLSKTRDNERHAWLAVWIDIDTGFDTENYSLEDESKCEKWARIKYN